MLRHHPRMPTPKERERDMTRLIKPIWAWASGAYHLTRGQLHHLKIVQRRMMSYCLRALRLPGETWVDAHRRRFRTARETIDALVCDNPLICWANLAVIRHWRYFGHCMRSAMPMMQLLLSHKNMEWWRQNRGVVVHPRRWYVRRHEQDVYAYCRAHQLNLAELTQDRHRWQSHEGAFMCWMFGR